MEINMIIVKILKPVRSCICTMILLFSFAMSHAQVCKIKDGKMYIELPKNINESVLDSFIVNFDLADLALKYFMKTNNGDSLQRLGWRVELNSSEILAVSKELISSDDLLSVADKIIFTSKDVGNSALFPATDNGQVFGYNKFRKKAGFETRDSIVTFYLQNNLNRNKVMLAGSFNNWSEDAMPMTKTDSGWIANVKLVPGKYWYKFIVDNNWILDDDNQLRENDGLGNTNSVFYKTNYLFKLDTFSNAKKIFLSGSFNNWKPRETVMKRTASGWELPVYLANGTHTYKYVVDGNWITDPGNPDRFPNEFNDFNSVIHFGKPFLFTLKGFENARTVTLTGSFNHWRKDELYMKKSAECWEFPYSLGAGNYEYRFVVDGKEITDPDNPVLVNNNGNMNSYLVLDPNYTFRLSGYPNANKVNLAGDFNGFNPNLISMKKAGDDWEFSLHLSRGKHLYKFIVDGNWIKDPANKLWEQNNYSTGDSVLWIVN